MNECKCCKFWEDDNCSKNFPPMMRGFSSGCTGFKEKKKEHLCESCRFLKDDKCDVPYSEITIERKQTKEIFTDTVVECNKYKKKILFTKGGLNHTYSLINALNKPYFTIQPDPFSNKWETGETIEFDNTTCKFVCESDPLKSWFKLYKNNEISIDTLIKYVTIELEDRRRKFISLDDLHSNLCAYRDGLKDCETNGFSFFFTKRTVFPAQTVEEELEKDTKKYYELKALNKFKNKDVMNKKDYEHLTSLVEKHKQTRDDFLLNSNAKAPMFFEWCDEYFKDIRE